MAATYEKIATTTLGTASATITLGSIPATYTDLRIILVAKTSSYLENWIQFNSDTGANYSNTSLYGAPPNVGVVNTNNGTNIKFHYYGTPASPNPGYYDLNLMNYAGSNYKTLIATANESDNGGGAMTVTAGLWSSTSAVTSITLGSASNTYAVGTIVTIYGIKAV
jgi:hypothetical protein